MLEIKARLTFGENTEVSEPCIYGERLTRQKKKQNQTKKPKKPQNRIHLLRPTSPTGQTHTAPPVLPKHSAATADL